MAKKKDNASPEPNPDKASGASAPTRRARTAKAPARAARKPAIRKKEAASEAPVGSSESRTSSTAVAAPETAPKNPTEKSVPIARSNGHHSLGAGTHAIQVVNARENNLKGVTAMFPRGGMTVVTGVSGSGKSSLVFDTLFAEGRRRFTQSLSTYARQFLDKLGRPQVDAIHNIQPAIALEQRNHVKNARSTVGTASEVHDYLRLIFARASEVICPDCERPVIERTPHALAVELSSRPDGTRIVLTAPVRLTHKDLAHPLRQSLRQMGFSRLWLDGDSEELDDLEEKKLQKLDVWPVVIDRVVARADGGTEERQQRTIRLASAIQTAFRVGKDELAVHEAPKGSTKYADGRTYFAGLRCEGCGRAFHRPEPDLFSFYSPLGACPRCEGYGRVTGIDWNKAIRDPSLSLEEGVIVPWSTPGYDAAYRTCLTWARKVGIPTDKPYNKLTAAQQRQIREGAPGFEGVRGFFDALAAQKHKVQARIMVARYRSFENCPDCDGTRLRPETRAFRVGGKTLGELGVLPVADLRKWWDDFSFDDPARAAAAKRLLNELRARLGYLDRVGLGYLALDRQTRTLSGGESQRVNLSTALGSALTDTLYVLDEPTVGLHARDTERLLQILHGLRDNGNTVVIVEHDKEVMRGADWMVDIGPKAGELGGELIFEGTVAQLEAHKTSATGDYLRREKTARVKSGRELRTPREWIGARGARERTLKNIDVDFPLGALCCVAGVSGSGKSTLVRDILHAGWARLKMNATEPAGAHRELVGWEALSEMVFVDQAPIGRSARSNPVTYTGAWNEVREMMASTLEAKRVGAAARDFSFNVKGGRCEACEGAGVVAIDLHFLGEVSVECEACSGKRFKDHVLSIRHRGKNVHEILSMTVNESLDFFAMEKKCRDALRPLADVGLGYLRLGQSTATLSGGELQRLKLATYLGGAKTEEKKLLIFDEPTTGLHPADLDQLISVFDRLVDAGYSILVIEHNLDLIARADWVIELGPEGGEAGGQLVFAGPPSQLLRQKDSPTARHLAKLVERG